MRYTYWLNEVNLGDVSKVGGKCASLGEMIQNLDKMKIKVPFGFAVSCYAYQTFLEYNNLLDIIDEKLRLINYNDEKSIREISKEIRTLIQNGDFPEKMTEEIIQKYIELSNMYNIDETDVAVRSSATTEDLENASFAGQQDTYLNVIGKGSLLEKIKNCFASIFNERAVDYRHNLNFDSFDIKLSVAIQKMVRSDLGSAGVCFSIDTESGNNNVVVINSSYGLGEMVVSGQVEPDEFIIFKPKLFEGYNSIIDKKLGNKTEKMVYNDSIEKRVKKIPVKDDLFFKFSLSDENAIKLSKWVCEIEKYYTEVKGHWCPVDIEWAYDGILNELFIVQSRPETVISNKNNNILTSYNFTQSLPEPIAEGIAVGDKIGSGTVNVLMELGEKEFKEGSVLVAPITDPDWEPLMKKASAIVCEKGGRTCHASIVARELGIPAIVGVKNCTKRLKDNQMITVSCNQGDIGYIFNGKILYEKVEQELDNLPEPPVKIMMNVGNPASAFINAKIPNSGVSLAREEFILSSFIKIHPMALLHPERIEDINKRNELYNMIKGYKNGAEYFIERLAFGIGRIAGAFYPNPVILRTGDMKTNEYRLLFGGEYFEPDERNPMIGYRGCSRYYDENYKEAFGLECLAIKRVREKMGLDNLIVMLPFCRTVDECIKTQSVMKEYGLERGVNGFQLYLMAEIPSNFILADKFLDHCDGFSIGSNDITQLALGLDRDNELLQHIYNEEDETVKEMIKNIIKTCKRRGKKIGICGQGPSDKLSFAKFLIDEGIDSLGLIPESVIKTIISLQDI